jgi:hypothetical protein
VELAQAIHPLGDLAPAEDLAAPHPEARRVFSLRRGQRALERELAQPELISLADRDDEGHRRAVGRQLLLDRADRRVDVAQVEVVLVDRVDPSLERLAPVALADRRPALGQHGERRLARQRLVAAQLDRRHADELSLLDRKDQIDPGPLRVGRRPGHLDRVEAELAQLLDDRPANGGHAHRVVEVARLDRHLRQPLRGRDRVRTAHVDRADARLLAHRVAQPDSALDQAALDAHVGHAAEPPDRPHVGRHRRALELAADLAAQDRASRRRPIGRQAGDVDRDESAAQLVERDRPCRRGVDQRRGRPVRRPAARGHGEGQGNQACGAPTRHGHDSILTSMYASARRSASQRPCSRIIASSNMRSKRGCRTSSKEPIRFGSRCCASL